MISFIFLCFFLAGSRGGFGSDGSDLFAKANEAYRNQDYQRAFEMYQQVAKEGPRAEVYYNLGNAAFKQNRLGLAVLNYQRSLRLNPRDEDATNNLKYARSLVEYRVEDKRNWYVQRFLDVLSKLRFKECMMAASLVYLVLILIWNGALFIRKRFIMNGFVAFLFSVWAVLALVTCAKFYEARIQRSAVVIEGKADVRYGPSTSDKLAFSLVEGIEVFVDDQTDDWYRISLVNGSSGWMLKDRVEMI